MKAGWEKDVIFSEADILSRVVALGCSYPSNHEHEWEPLTRKSRGVTSGETIGYLSHGT